MTRTNSLISEAAALMDGFASRGRRYLWTDAYAVTNYLALANITQEPRWQKAALDLVESVHHVLGRHRPDDARRGWISGLSDHDGERHPTQGGLRIGKPLRERLVTEDYDPDLEWERDGQYFHYLTKWMHALGELARAADRPIFLTWARELAAFAHGAFTDGPSWNRRMFWKISIDGARPLVRSMGQHDPLDGYVTCVELDAWADALSVDREPSLVEATTDFERMLEQMNPTTADPLGLGGLLTDAGRLEALGGHEALVSELREHALLGIETFMDAPDLRLPANRRLAFRELGLAIGLGEGPLADEITAFWREPAHRRAATWTDHEDINDVMLATSLLSRGSPGNGYV